MEVAYIEDINRVTKTHAIDLGNDPYHPKSNKILAIQILIHMWLFLKL